MQVNAIDKSTNQVAWATGLSNQDATANAAVFIPYNAPPPAPALDFAQMLHAAGASAAGSQNGSSQNPAGTLPAPAPSFATLPSSLAMAGTGAAMPGTTTAITPAISSGMGAVGQGMSGSNCCCCSQMGMQINSGGAQAAASPQGLPAASSSPGSGSAASLKQPFQQPAAVTQPFGPTSFAAEPSYNGYAHFHTGIDFGLPPGTAVDAAAGGRVVAAGWDAGGFGNRVLIDHGNGLLTLYGHLESTNVVPGQEVQAGQQIGLSGSTGNSTGPHLHFGVEQGGRWVDPAPYLSTGGQAPSGASTPSTLATLGMAPAPVVNPIPLPGGNGASSAQGGGSAAGYADVPALIQQISQTTGVSSSLIAGVVQTESAGNPRAVSPAGAKGLMQLMDSTASAYGVTDVFDPRQNLLGGAMYLRGLLQRYKGNEQLALAAYNAGPAAVDRYGGIPPYAETQQYVQRVTAFQRQYAVGSRQPAVGSA